MGYVPPKPMPPDLARRFGEWARKNPELYRELELESQLRRQRQDSSPLSSLCSFFTGVILGRFAE